MLKTTLFNFYRGFTVFTRKKKQNACLRPCYGVGVWFWLVRKMPRLRGRRRRGERSGRERKNRNNNNIKRKEPRKPWERRSVSERPKWWSMSAPLRSSSNTVWEIIQHPSFAAAFILFFADRSFSPRILTSFLELQTRKKVTFFFN